MLITGDTQGVVPGDTEVVPVLDVGEEAGCWVEWQPHSGAAPIKMTLVNRVQPPANRGRNATAPSFRSPDESRIKQNARG
jgi:hypothetical protein